MNDTAAFFRNFLRHPRDISSVIPTSKRAVRRVCGKIQRDARVIVEYGPGTGVVAKHLLRENLLRPDAKVLLIEKTPELAERLAERIDDHRVHVVCDTAENVDDILKRHGEAAADAVLSSIPLSVMPADVRRRIIRKTYDVLAPHGSFIVFLFRRRVDGWLREAFPVVRRELELLNIPPLFIFEAKKRDSADAPEARPRL